MKILICGPRESAWTEEQIPKAKWVIRRIILDRLKKIEDIINGPNLTHGERQQMAKLYRDNPLTIVSGHCPKGEEKPYCVSCGAWLITDEDVLTHIDKLGHNVIKVYDKGGIDTFVEIIATELGIKKKIYAPEVNQWEDKREVREPKIGNWILKKGYRSRNIDMAKAFDVGYCITPKDKEAYCHWHKTYGHVSSGDCFTILEGEKLGKEVHLVVIE